MNVKQSVDSLSPSLPGGRYGQGVRRGASPLGRRREGSPFPGRGPDAAWRKLPGDASCILQRGLLPWVCHPRRLENRPIAFVSCLPAGGCFRFPALVNGLDRLIDEGILFFQSGMLPGILFPLPGKRARDREDSRLAQAGGRGFPPRNSRHRESLPQTGEGRLNRERFGKQD